MLMSPTLDQTHTLKAFRAFANESVEGLVQNPMGECLSEAASSLSLAASQHNAYQQVLPF